MTNGLGASCNDRANRRARRRRPDLFVKDLLCFSAQLVVSDLDLLSLDDLRLVERSESSVDARNVHIFALHHQAGEHRIVFDIEGEQGPSSAGLLGQLHDKRPSRYCGRAAASSDGSPIGPVLDRETDTQRGEKERHDTQSLIPALVEAENSLVIEDVQAGNQRSIPGPLVGGLRYVG